MPFDALEYFISIINYGGRVTDSNDEKLLCSILRGIINPGIILPNYCIMGL
jgi:hypothetical protein